MKILSLILLVTTLSSCKSPAKHQESPSEKLNKIESNSNNIFKDL
ncbi:MAG: hypothetical protein ACKO6C_01190 [Alphaproteobacteria bacterium]